MPLLVFPIHACTAARGQGATVFSPLAVSPERVRVSDMLSSRRPSNMTISSADFAGAVTSNCSPTTVASISMSPVRTARCLNDARGWTPRHPPAGHAGCKCFASSNWALTKTVGTNGEGSLNHRHSGQRGLRNDYTPSAYRANRNLFGCIPPLS